MAESEARRQLPSVNAVLDHELLADPMHLRGRIAVRRAVRQALDEFRKGLREGKSLEADLGSIVHRSREILDGERSSLRPVINATGVLLHTGLGRSPLAPEAVAAVAEVASGYCNLEFDLDDGMRGRRTSAISGILRELIGAEAATVVNNNAGATVLALRAMAAGREVIVSRGELVEIGGSFRLPEIFEVSGARLREVGTTNKTRLSDYKRGSAPRRPPSCGSIPATSGSSGSPRLRRLRTWSNWPMPMDSGPSTTSARVLSGRNARQG